MDTAKVFRTAEIYFPAVRTLKQAIQNCISTIFKKPFRHDFEGLRHFRSANFILDIGAYRGQSILAFKIFFPDAQLMAIEANPILAESLRQKFKADSSVRVISAAITPKMGKQDFFVPFYRGVCLDALGATNFNEAAILPAGAAFHFFNNRHLDVRSYKVECLTIDSLGLRPNIIKLNIQKGELDALKGAEETLTIARPIVMVSWPHGDIFDYLSQLSYKHFGYKDGRFVPGLRSYIGWFLMPEHQEQIGRRL